MFKTIAYHVRSVFTPRTGYRPVEADKPPLHADEGDALSGYRKPPT